MTIKEHFRINNKQRIVEATFVLSLKKGFDNVSMKQIQEESGLAAGSIYYHFKNKDDLLLYIVNKYILSSLNQLKKDISKFNGSFMEKIRHIFTFKITSIGKEEESLFTSNTPEFDHKDYYMLITSIYHHYPQTRDMFTKLHDNLYDFYYELIQEAIENKEIRGDIDIKTLVIFIQTILKGYIDLYVYQPHISFEELVDANLKMIQEAIKKNDKD